MGPAAIFTSAKIPSIFRNFLFSSISSLGSLGPTSINYRKIETLSELFRKPVIYEDYNLPTDMNRSRLSYPFKSRTSANKLLSPVDGEIVQSGKIENSEFKIKIKDEFIKLNSIIPNDNISNYNYILLYLSPSDYHRFHSPLDFNINKNSLRMVNWKI